MDTKLEKIEFSKGTMRLLFRDGGECLVPLTDYPRLLTATEAQRNRWEILGSNRGIHWPEVDEHLTISGLLRDYAAPVAPARAFSSKHSHHLL
jgi:hypothetical protein